MLHVRLYCETSFLFDFGTNTVTPNIDPPRLIVQRCMRVHRGSSVDCKPQWRGEAKEKGFNFRGNFIGRKVCVGDRRITTWLATRRQYCTRSFLQHSPSRLCEPQKISKWKEKILETAFSTSPTCRTNYFLRVCSRAKMRDSFFFLIRHWKVRFCQRIKTPSTSKCTLTTNGTFLFADV